jgi:hypothetical protein
VETSDDEASLSSDFKTIPTITQTNSERRRSYYLTENNNNYKNSHGLYGSPAASLPVPTTSKPKPSPPPIRRAKTVISPYMKTVLTTAVEKTMVSSLDESSYREVDEIPPESQQFSSLSSDKVGLTMTQSIYKPFDGEESDEDPAKNYSDDSDSDESFDSIETVPKSEESIYTTNAGAEDWNSKFQMILDMPQDTTEEKLTRAKDLYKLTQSFIATATRIASTIIKEIGLLPPMKTIKPKAFGGLAGGEKVRT